MSFVCVFGALSFSSYYPVHALTTLHTLVSPPPITHRYIAPNKGTVPK